MKLTKSLFEFVECWVVRNQKFCEQTYNGERRMGADDSRRRWVARHAAQRSGIAEVVVFVASPARPVPG